MEQIKKHFPEIILIENKKNLGFAEGNNAGIRYAMEKGADYIMILNNDTVADKNLINVFMKKINQNSILSPKIYFYPGKEYHHDRYEEKEKGKVIWYAGGIIDWKNVLCSHRGVDEVDSGQYDKTEETEFISGCCMFIPVEVFKKIGLLDARYFAYLEDVDFCERAKAAGIKLIYEPKAIVWHKNAGSFGGVGTLRQDYLFTRNRLLFGYRYAPWRTKFALFRESLRYVIQGGTKRQAIRDYYFNKEFYDY